VLTYITPYFWAHIYSGDKLNMLSWDGFGAMYDINGPIQYLFLVAYGVVSIGLIFFQPWSKQLFLGLTLLSIAITLFSGISVYEPINGLLGYIMTLIDGSILTMIYFTSVSKEFVKNT